MKKILIALGLLPAIGAEAQTPVLQPRQQVTLLRYAGPQINPVVPVALLDEKTGTAHAAAQWLAGQRKAPLRTVSLSPDSLRYIGETEKNLERLFASAASDSAVLFFDEADALFGKAALDEREQAWQRELLIQVKRYPGSVLFNCAREACWYALAKAGCGIVKLD